MPGCGVWVVLIVFFSSMNCVKGQFYFSNNFQGRKFCIEELYGQIRLRCQRITLAAMREEWRSETR